MLASFRSWLLFGVLRRCLALGQRTSEFQPNTCAARANKFDAIRVAPHSYCWSWCSVSLSRRTLPKTTGPPLAGPGKIFANAMIQLHARVLSSPASNR